MSKPERFQILVVGAGPAGMAAAVVAASSASKNTAIGVVDDNPAAGGQIWRGGKPPAGDRLAAEWLRRFEQAGIARIHGSAGRRPARAGHAAG